MQELSALAGWHYLIYPRWPSMFIIEDEVHAEWCGEFESFEEALAELRARSTIARELQPNVCPCTSWKTCSREYSIVEFDTSREPWSEVSRTPVLAVSSNGATWEKGFRI